MSKQLSTGEAIVLVERLKSTVEELAARADKLNADFRLQIARERQRGVAALDEESARSAAVMAESEAVFRQEEAGILARYEGRKAWISRAYQTSKEQRLKEIEDRVGARKYELQKKMLQAEKDRDAALAAETGRFSEFSAEAQAEKQSLEDTERQAQRAFAGYGSFRRGFFAAYEKTGEVAGSDEKQLLNEARDLNGKAAAALRDYRRKVLLTVFRLWPLWIVLALLCFALVPGLERAGVKSFTYPLAGACAAGLAALVFVGRSLAIRSAGPMAQSISQSLARARQLQEACVERSRTHHQQEIERIKSVFQQTTQTSDQQLKQAVAEAGQRRVACRMETDERTVEVNRALEQAHRARLARTEREYAHGHETLRKAAETRKRSLSQALDEKIKSFEGGLNSGWQRLQSDWEQRVVPIYSSLCQAHGAASALFPSWPAVMAAGWAPPKQFAQAVRYAELAIDLGKFCNAVPNDSRLSLPGGGQFPVPLSLVYPQEGSLLVETRESGQQEVIGALNNIILRLLAVSPPGRLNFTVIDPVGLGQNFAGIMHLADYEEQLINSRIWTQSSQIEEKLADLNEHMEKVIQMYLRNEYQTIAEYNEQAGVIAEKYHFLVVADFPAGFTDTAARRLLSIAASGPRCGVYTLIHWDLRQPLPQDFLPEELRKTSVCLTFKDNRFIFTGRPMPGTQLGLDEPPGPDLATEFIHQVGRASRDSSRVEVPFEHVLPPENEIWQEDTTTELRVPIGRTGATKLQYLAIGKGTCQHGLIAGKTGSGKSTLFHVIITNLAMWCSPEQVEFYLVDFKKGVEFKCYASRRLPHARVVAIESDREFGLSVLQRVDDELRRRGDLFRKLGAQDIAGYKRAGGKESIPRSLLIIDEFQEFFVEDDKIAQTASLLLDRIVRQGRAFGIHVLLGSQTLGGAYTVARTTLGQMVIRVALQCNEADAYLIMDDDNPAPRLLSRPGEGIYNDSAGAIEGNSPFQVVWLPDQVRDRYLAQVRARADQTATAYPGPIVFEGNAPADVAENALLQAAIEAPAINRPAFGRIWLGAPNSIKGPTEAVFHRQSGNHLMIVGQREEAILAMLTLALVALGAQYPAGEARLIFCDTTPAGTPERDLIERVVRNLPHQVTLAKPGDLNTILPDLVSEMKQRAESANPEAAPPVYLLIHDLQRFAKLRYEEDFGFASGDAEASPGALLNSLICEGARLGFHLIINCDSYNNVGRFLSRKAVSEFEMRVLFQMSPTDSASLIDSPKAGTLGLHRALFYNQQEGHLETFRPYSLPPAVWFDQAGGGARRAGS